MIRRKLYIPIDLNFADDPKIADAGEAAGWLYLRVCCRIKQLEQDGWISAAQVGLLGIRNTPARLTALLSTGALVQSERGYEVPSWFAWHEPVADVRAKRARDAGRKRPESERNPDGIPPDEPEGIQTESARSLSRKRESKRESDGTTDVVPLPAASGGALIKAWIDGCRERPPDRVVGQVAKHVGELLAEGHDPQAIHAALTELRVKALNPATLPSLLNGVLNPATSTPRNDKLAPLRRAAERLGQQPPGLEITR